MFVVIEMTRKEMEVEMDGPYACRSETKEKHKAQWNHQIVEIFVL